MKQLWTSGIVLLVLAGPAVAREGSQNDNPRSRPKIQFAQMEMHSEGGMMPGPGHAAGGDQGQSTPGGSMPAKPEMMQHMHGMMMRHMREHEEEHEHGGGRGAYLRFKRGDAEVDIRCPEDESMRDCLSAAATLLDKLGPLSGEPGQPPSSSH
jgi:hypothetical protein